MGASTSNKPPSRLVMAVLRLIGYVISKTFWFIRYRGIENLPPADSPPYIIAANHQTYLDPVWICLPVRAHMRFMAIGNAFEWRVIGPFIRYLGAFPVSADPKQTLGAMKEALRAVRSGSVLTIFPEGQRAFADGNMFPFKTGVARIAVQAGVPVLPVTVVGGNRIWPQGQRYPNLFRRVEVIYHPLLEVGTDDSDEAIEEWTARLEAKIEGALRLAA